MDHGVRGGAPRRKFALESGAGPTIMPSHGGRFDSLAGLLASPPRVRRLGCSLPDDDAEFAAVRSCCAGSLASCIVQLNVAIEPHVLHMLDGRLPTSDAFRGDDRDLSKLKALKTVATMIQQHGCMLFSEATVVLVAARSKFFADLNEALDADHFDVFALKQQVVRELQPWRHERRL